MSSIPSVPLPASKRLVSVHVDRPPKSPTHDEKPTATQSTEYPLYVKVIACLGLVFVQVFAAVVMKIAQKDGTYLFSPQSSLVMSETIKTIFSFIYLFMEPTKQPHQLTALPDQSLSDSPDRSDRTNTSKTLSLNDVQRTVALQSSRPLVLHMVGLAALYCINNAIMFWLFARADPGSISLIKSGATIVSAILMYVWRHFKLSLSKWLVIVIQMFGLVIAQYDSCRNKSLLPPTVYLVLIISLLNSSIANVWNEHVIKSFKFSGLAVKNIYLYAFGAVFNLLFFFYSRAAYPGSTPFFFQGYNLAALGVVTSNAFIGIAMNAVYKYADALIKNLATTTTTVILLVLSAWFFNGRNDIMVLLGAVIVICGTFLYFLLGTSEQHMKQLEASISANTIANNNNIDNR